LRERERLREEVGSWQLAASSWGEERGKGIARLNDPDFAPPQAGLIGTSGRWP